MDIRRIPKWQYLYDIDLFGKQIELYYKGKNKRASLIGIIFTILYLIIYLSFFLYLFIAMIKKTNVNFYDTIKVSDKPPFMQLNNEMLYLGICIKHPITKKCFIDQSIYTINVTYASAKKVEDLDFEWKWDYDTNIPTEECQLSKFGSNYQEIFKKRNLKGLNCLQNFSRLIEGSSSYDSYSYYDINIYPCINTTENNNMCKTEEEINYSLSNTHAIFIMQDIVLSPQNHNSPVKFIEKQLFFSLAQESTEIIDAFWQKINIETNKDLLGFGITDKIETQQYLKFDKNTINFYGKNVFDNILSFRINLSEQELTETRTYLTLATVLGDVGGFTGVIFSIFNLILGIITDTLYNKSLINHLFSFDIDNKLFLVKKKDIKLYNQSEIIQINKIKFKKTAKSETDSKKDNNNKLRNSFLSSTENNIKNIRNILNVDKSIKRNDRIRLSYDSYPTEGSGKYEHINKKENKDESKKEIILNESRVIKKIELNPFKPKCCFGKKREFIENILFEESMKIIQDKLDIQNIFKNMYKENNVYGYIKMSDGCKISIEKINDIYREDIY